MKFDFIQDEWEGFVEAIACKPFTDAMEASAAEELIHAKKYVPQLKQILSGIDKVDSEEEILKNRMKLLYMVVYFVGESMGLDAETMSDGKVHVTIWVYNVPLFTTVVCMGIAATLYHLTGALPLSVSIVCENKKRLDIFKEAGKAITDLFDLESVRLIAGDEDDCPDEK